MGKKIYLITAILIALLYAAIFLYQGEVIDVSVMGQLFGYLYYVVIICGIVACIWLFIKPKKKND